MKEIYLLVHDYDGLCGPVYQTDTAKLSFARGDLVLECKTLSENQDIFDLLSSESDRHFRQIIKQLFPNCAIHTSITRDIYRYDLSYTIMPQDKLPIPTDGDGVELWQFYHYDIFGSSLIGLQEYLSYEYRDYYDVFHVFDQQIASL